VEIGIVGLPQSGKTTVFNALTGAGADTGGYSAGRDRFNRAVVKLSDERLDRLVEMFEPAKWTPADVTFIDMAGMARDRMRGDDVEILQPIRQADALAHVVRAFEDEMVPHPAGSVDPRRDVEELDLTMLLTDLDAVAGRLDRIVKESKVKKADQFAAEKAVLERCREHLEAERPLRSLELAPDQERLIRGFQLLSRKPLLVVVNLGEEDERDDEGFWTTELFPEGPGEQTRVAALRGKIEMEIAQLAPEDAAMFLEEMGLAEPGLDRLVRRAYELLGLVSYFTFKSREVRAWTVGRDTPAAQAAGAIHSDLERGFIRAEVVSFDDLMSCGGWSESRAKGLLRSEGREYRVRDGDVIEFLVNV